MDPPRTSEGDLPRNSEEGRQILWEKYVKLALSGQGSYGFVHFVLPKSRVQEENSKSKQPGYKPDYDALRREVIAIKESRRTILGKVFLTEEIRFMKKIQENLKNAKHDLTPHFLQHLESLTTQEDDSIFYSMEAVSSGLTANELHYPAKNNKIPIPEELIFHLLLQCIRIFRFLHETCHLLHNDMSERNVMIRYPGKVKAYLPDFILIDFGTSRTIASDEDNPDAYEKDTHHIFEVFKELMALGQTCSSKPGKEINHRYMICCDKNRHSDAWRKLQELLLRKDMTLAELEKNISEQSEAFTQEIVPGTKVQKSVDDFLQSAMTLGGRTGPLIPDEVFLEKIQNSG